MRLYFIRHGQTDYNLKKLPQGQEIDAPLNETGRAQAEKAAEFLPKNIDVFYSSPMKRTLQTAEILNKKLEKEILVHDLIKEMSYGSLAGKTWPEIEHL